MLEPFDGSPDEPKLVLVDDEGEPIEDRFYLATDCCGRMCGPKHKALPCQMKREHDWEPHATGDFQDVC